MNLKSYLCYATMMLLFIQSGCDSKLSSNKETLLGTNATATNNPPKLNVDYDARQFLSKADVIAFNRVFPDFDGKRPEKDWEWKDVDPLGLDTPAKNRQIRRDFFLFELTPQNLQDNAGSPSSDQIAFKQVLERESPSIEVLLTARTAKILCPFTEGYETNGTTFCENLLMKTAGWGLRWSQVGGKSLYIYNGNILISRFKYGYVSLPSSDIDRPFSKEVYIK